MMQKFMVLFALLLIGISSATYWDGQACSANTTVLTFDPGTMGGGAWNDWGAHTQKDGGQLRATTDVTVSAICDYTYVDASTVYVQDDAGNPLKNATTSNTTGTPCGQLQVNISSGSYFYVKTDSATASYHGAYLWPVTYSHAFTYANATTGTVNGGDNPTNWGPVWKINLTTNTTNTTACFSSVLSNATIHNVVNDTIGHSFTFNASVTDSAGGSNISAVSVSVVNGSCSQINNGTPANLFWARYNCSSVNQASAGYTVLFNASVSDSLSAYGTNYYPNNKPNLTQPVVAPNPAYNTSNFTCVNGTFTDIDGDVENVSARSWNWQRNGTLLSGYTASTLAVNFNTTDSITCNETTSAMNWTATATNASAAVVISASLSNATIRSTTDATSGHWFTVNASVDSDYGGSNITAVSVAVVNGTTIQMSNGTGGNTFWALYNFSSLNQGLAGYTFTFNASAVSASVSGSHNYPDIAPALGAPSITPGPGYINSTFTCNNGTLTDADGDIENVSARSWNWAINGSTIGGQTNQTLTAGNFGVSDLLTCNETTRMQNWTAAAASGASASVAVSGLTCAMPAAFVSKTSPTNASLINATSIMFAWNNMTTDDNVCNVTYMLCYNTSAGVLNYCYYNIAADNYTLTLPNGSVVQWDVLATNGSANSWYGSPYVFSIYIMGVQTAQSLKVGSIDTVLWNYWLQWGKLFVAVFVIGMASLMFTPLSSSAFASSIGLLTVCLLPPVLSPEYALAAGAVLVIGSLLRASGR